MGICFDGASYPYLSRRSVVFARNGMVATSQPLAAQAGLDILRRGGNAIDAAIATAACMTVVEPTSNGLGSDAFALVWAEGRLHGLNGSGWAPAKMTAEALEGLGVRGDIPDRGWLPVTVPGAPSAWAELHRRFGRMPFAKLLEHAIEYARDGYPMTPVISGLWGKELGILKAYKGRPEFAPWFETFLPSGRVPASGETVRLSDHARTLKILAETYCEDFYRGDIARKIDSFSRATGGLLRKEDLAGYRAEWVEPVSVSYRGYDVWELPPNGHGIAVLMALNILGRFDFPEKESAATYHRQIEAMKLAFADALKYVADPRYMGVKVSDLLSPAYARERARLIGEAALMPEAGRPFSGGTVYLCAADREGNMVSFIQSNFKEFGSGIVVPGLGIALNDRGCGFKLDPASDNFLMPGKKPYHTIIPGFLTKGGEAVGPFGVMGGYMQPQGHVQVIMNALDFQLNPQAALDAPRWQWLEGKRVQLEDSVGREIIEGLAARGHQVEVTGDYSVFGRGQIIWRGEDGVLWGATEPRADGAVAAW